MTDRQIIETRLGRPLGPVATMPRDLRRALYLLALQLVRNHPMTHDTTPPKRIAREEAQAAVDPNLVAEILRDFGTNFDGVYPVDVLARGVGPEQSMIGLAIKRGHLLSRSHADAMVAAALREAARVAVEAAFDYWEETKKPVEQRKHGSKDLPACVAAEIKALIPQPAAAALDKLIAEAEARGMELAANIAEKTPTGLATNGEFFSERVAKAIRAAKGAAK